MWTSRIVSRDLYLGFIRVVVSYENGGINSDFSEKYDIQSLLQLNNMIAVRLIDLNKLDLSSIPTGNYVPTEPTPTPSESDKAKYFVLLNKYNQVQDAINKGLIKSDDASVTQLITDLKTAYKPEYSGL